MEETMKGKWHWPGDELRYSVDDIDVFKVGRMHTDQLYCAQRTDVKLSAVEQKQLAREGLERYAQRSV